MSLLGEVPPRQAMPQAKTEALLALEIDDTIAGVHMSLAWVRHWYDWDWNGAEAEYKRALELNPADAEAWVRYAEFCAFMGRREESITLATRAVKLDPVSVEINRTFALVLIMARRWEDAITQCRETIELDPNYFHIHFYCGLAYAAEGKHHEAVELCERARSLGPGEPYPEGVLAWVYAVTGRKAEARAILAELLRRRTEAYFSPCILAWIYTGLGDVDEAFRWLDTAYAERDGLLVEAKVLYLFDPLRMDLRFRELLRRMRLED